MSGIIRAVYAGGQSIFAAYRLLALSAFTRAESRRGRRAAERSEPAEWPCHSTGLVPSVKEKRGGGRHRGGVRAESGGVCRVAGRVVPRPIKQPRAWSEGAQPVQSHYRRAHHRENERRGRCVQMESREGAPLQRGHALQTSRGVESRHAADCPELVIALRPVAAVPQARQDWHNWRRANCDHNIASSANGRQRRSRKCRERIAVAHSQAVRSSWLQPLRSAAVSSQSCARATTRIIPDIHTTHHTTVPHLPGSSKAGRRAGMRRGTGRGSPHTECWCRAYCRRSARAWRSSFDPLGDCRCSTT